jgi:hypothetical protein
MLSHQVTFLTRNTQHAGILSPYFADGILTIDRHTLAFLLLNENSFTPLRRGAQADIAQHRIQNLPPRRQRTAPSGHTPGGPPPPSVTHVVGVCRLAYSKKAPWAPAIRPLLLPANSPHSPPLPHRHRVRDVTRPQKGATTAIIACYLPKSAVEHASVCKHSVVYQKRSHITS